MKIAFFTDTFVPQINGVVTSVLNFSNSLAARGHQIHIFTVKPNKKVHLGPNITTTYYNQSEILDYPGFGLAIPHYFDCYRTLRTFKPDIIHIHTPTPLGWEALISAKILGIPVIGTYHTILPEFLNYMPLPKRITNSDVLKRITWKYTNKFYGNCDFVVAPSLAIKKELKKNGLTNHIAVISNGVDLAQFYPEKQHKTIDILHVGRISYEKNIEVLIHAIPIIKKIIPHVHLVIAGKGPDEQALHMLTKKLQLTKNIAFTGPVSHTKLIHFYNRARLFATASTIETEGLVILEAMACGLPIIGVKKLALQYLIKDNGLLSKPGDPKALAKNIITLLTNEQRRAIMRNHSLQRIQQYSLHHSIKKIETLYQKLKK